MSGSVYFIRPVGMAGPIKIGYSICPAQRILDLHAQSPFPLELIGMIDGPPSLEGQVHNHLRDHWSHHEWFFPTDAVLSFVGMAISGCLPKMATGPFKRVGHDRADMGGDVRKSLGLSLTWAAKRHGLRRLPEHSILDAARTERRALTDQEAESLRRAVVRYVSIPHGGFPPSDNQGPPADTQIAQCSESLQIGFVVNAGVVL